MDISNGDMNVTHCPSLHGLTDFVLEICNQKKNTGYKHRDYNIPSLYTFTTCMSLNKQIFNNKVVTLVADK